MESEITDEKGHSHDDVPFHGSLTVDQSDPSTSGASTTVRHRLFSGRGSSSKEPDDSLTETYKFHRDLNPNDDISEVTESTTHVDEIVATQRRNSAESGTELSDSLHSSLSLLMFMTRLTTKSIWFLLKLTIRFITFPITVLIYLIIFAIDPLRPLRQIAAYAITMLIKLWLNSPCGRLVLGFGWGILRAAYLAFVLCLCLLASLVISGILMRYLAEQPFVVKETLNFDYTKTSPVAFVPIVSCATVERKKKIDVGMNLGSRIIRPFHELQVSVSLTLPESDYNRNLGMFQLRTDFLSINGETLASSSHPCMMRFKSLPIRLLLTLFKAAPLVSGFVFEIQTLNLKIKRLNRGPVPACLKIVLEQRASHGPGAGIPELYGASLVLESELPFIKRIIWYWRKTVFIWVSIASFATELLFISVCCRCVLLPHTRKMDGSAGRHR
ncbi:hypothetical protein GQ457_05G035850 [Hibiscus cannabinus]